MYLTDILFNSARLRFSVNQKRAMLKWAKDLGATDVPNLNSLQNIQKSLAEAIGNPTVKKTSRSGDVFHINEIGLAIGKVQYFTFYFTLSFRLGLGSFESFGVVSHAFLSRRW